MQLAAINFSVLAKVEYRSKQVERVVATGLPAPRTIYADAQFFFKIWPASNSDCRTVYWKGNRYLVNNRDQNNHEVLIGFLYGLYDESVCPAFVDHIYDGSSLVGYITRRGIPLPTQEEESTAFNDFVKVFFQRSLHSGLVHRDLKLRNVVRLNDGRLSLIDLECPLTLLNGFSRTRERRNGSLARFTSKRYRSLIKSYLNPINLSPKILTARARIKKRPPHFFGIQGAQSSG
jgi:hypothetical protein